MFKHSQKLKFGRADRGLENRKSRSVAENVERFLGREVNKVTGYKAKARESKATAETEAETKCIAYESSGTTF